MDEAKTILDSIAKNILAIIPTAYFKKRTKTPKPHSGESTSEEIASRLYEHYAKLKIFTEANSDACSNLKTIRRSDGTEIGADAIAYRLAATDLFVEKALDYLRHRAESYKWWGRGGYGIGILSVVIAIYFAATNFLSPCSPIDGKVPEVNLFQFLTHSFAAFTFYGLLVLLAVAAWRFGKAMLDQSERIYEKRHAMRQGRLYVHLRGGEIGIEELEKAFTWNVSNENAFSVMPTDAKAPMGAVLADMANSIKALTEALKAVTDAKQSGST